MILLDEEMLHVLRRPKETVQRCSLRCPHLANASLVSYLLSFSMQEQNIGIAKSNQ